MPPGTLTRAPERACTQVKTIADPRPGRRRCQTFCCILCAAPETQRRAFREFQAFDFFRKEQFDSEEFRQAVREAVEQAARERTARKDSDYMRGHHYESWQRNQGR